MNCFNISGQVKAFGEKGTTYKTLWVSIELPTEQTPNVVFVQFPLDANASSRKGKLGEYIKSQLQKGMSIFISDVTMTPLKFSKKNEAGEWVQEERIGLRGGLSNIILGGNYTAVNLALVEGKVTKHNEKKLIVEESYRNPASNEWKTRPIPVLIDDPVAYMYSGNNLVGKDVFILGKTAATETSVYLLAKNIISR